VNQVVTKVLSLFVVTKVVVVKELDN